MGREGDEEKDLDDPEFIVESYMARTLSMDPTAIYAVESDDE